MKTRILKRLIAAVMLGVLAMSLSACSFMDNAQNTERWEKFKVILYTALQASNIENEDSAASTEKEVVYVEEVQIAEPVCEYENYQNMSGEEQQKFVESFSSIEEFFSWLNDAKAKHEAHDNAIEVGNNTVIDMSGLVE